MSLSGPGRVSDAVAAAVAGLVVMAHSPALAQTKPQAGPAPAQVEKFTATTVNTSGAGEPLTIRLSRWSADADRERLASVLADKGAEGLRSALAGAQTLGYIWTSESVGYSLRYAHRSPLPDGGTRIVVVTDRALATGASNNRGSKTTDPETLPEYPFTVIELHLNRRGVGDGKMSLAAKVVADQNAKTIALENYKAAPVLLKDVRYEGPR